jgi:hypothetical protein
MCNVALFVLLECLPNHKCARKAWSAMHLLDGECMLIVYPVWPPLVYNNCGAPKHTHVGDVYCKVSSNAHFGRLAIFHD